MLVIDAQVHAYERNHAGRPWIGEIPGPTEVTGQDMVQAMNSAGVDAALLVSPFATYGFDPSYTVEVRAANPERFAMIAPVDHRRKDIADVIADWAAEPGAVGIRLLLSSHATNVVPLEVKDPGVERVMTAAARHRLPVCVLSMGDLPRAGELAAEYPDAQLVIDHLGLNQPVKYPRLADPFADLPQLLDLARFANIAVKVTGAATLSAVPFPFPDLHDPLRRVLDAFGLDRCMWGTDWTRATAFVSYDEAVAAFRDGDWLTASERTALMSGTLQTVFGWRPPMSGTARALTQADN